MNAPADLSGSLAASAQSLDKLRAQAKQAPDQALKAAAQQFESVFLNMMLKSMRDATPKDGLFDSEQTKMFTGMLDQQLAQSMSSRGIGLADVMVRQLSKTTGSGTLPATAALPRTLPAKYSAYSPSVSANPSSAQNTAAQALPSAFSENFQQGFVQQMTPYALQASQETGIPAQLMLGQAALESGWGKREIRLPDGSNSYNLFGIKAGNTWKGKVAEVATTEYSNGVPHKEVAKFRAYGSYAEAFSDYGNFIRNNPRYTSVVQSGQAAPAAAHALQRAGYATDPKYADKLVKVMGRISTIGG
jgi:flagellar protein FlgJ